MESFGKIILFFVLSLLLFLCPTYYYAIKQDNIIQSIVYKETVDFVNGIRNTGSITQETYNRFVKQLDQTGNVYQIEFVHQKMNDQSVVLENGKYKEYENYYTQEILNELNVNHRYYLKRNDYISIVIKNRNKTMGGKLQKLFLHQVQDVQIYVSYGGLIRDEIK